MRSGCVYHVCEQTASVVRLNRKLGVIFNIFLRRRPFGFYDTVAFALLQERNVCAVRTVDGNASASRDISDNLITRNGSAAAGKPYKAVVYAFDDYTVARSFMLILFVGIFKL